MKDWSKTLNGLLGFTHIYRERNYVCIHDAMIVMKIKKEVKIIMQKKI